jgi:hypothetical protein
MLPAAFKPKEEEEEEVLFLTQSSPPHRSENTFVLKTHS